jgi:PAS domain S-box-containing protein
MATQIKTKQALVVEVEALRARLEQTEAALRATKNGKTTTPAQLDPSQAFWGASHIHRTMLAQVSEAVIAVDNDQRVTYLNASAERQYGITAAEAMGCKLEELYRFQWLAPEDEANAFAQLRDEGAWRGENIHVRRDGNALRVESSVSVLTDDAGAPIGMLAVIRDVSKQRENEEAIRFQATLLDAVEQAVITTDMAGHITYWNRFAEQLYGWRAAEAMGRLIQEITPARTAQKQAQEIMLALQQGQTWTGEFMMQRKDGTTFPALVIDSPIRDPQGRQVGIIGISMDITERKEAEARVRQSEAYLRRVLDNLFAFVGVLLPDGTLIEANRAPLEAAGIWLEDVIGKKFWECYWWSYSPDVQAQLRDSVERANRGELVRYDVPVRVAGEERVWIDFQLSPLRDETGRITHLIPSAMDITARQQAEEQLRDSTHKLEQTNALLEAVLAEAPTGIVIYDKEMRYLRVNESLARINQLPSEAHIGRTAADVLGPERAGIINPILRKVLETGQAIAGLELSGPDGHFLTDSYPIQTTDGEIHGVGVTVIDITERKRREANAVFQGEIGDVLSRLSNPDEIMRVTGEKISNHMGATRVFFIEINQPNELSHVLYDWCKDDLPSTVGRYHISEYSDESFLNTLAAGKSFVIDDTASDARLAPMAAAKFAAMQIGAVLNTPYISNGQLRYVLAVQQRTAYAWRQDEI